MFNVIIFIFTFFLTYNVYAENEKYFVINDFSKGLNSKLSASKLPSDQFQTFQNFTIDDTYTSAFKRPAMKSYSSIDDFCTGLHRYYMQDGTQITIAGASTKLYAILDNDGIAKTIQTGLSSNRYWQFITYKGNVIATNGYDKPLKFDGLLDTEDNTTGCRTGNITDNYYLCAELGAPFIELNDTVSGLDSSSWYQYKYACNDGDVLYYSEAVSNPIKTGSTVTGIKLTDIPIMPDGIATQSSERYIFRTNGQSSKDDLLSAEFYLVSTISDNTTTTLIDSMSDATASSNATWATVSTGLDVTPPCGALIEAHKERIYLGRDPNNSSFLYYSEPLTPDWFNTEDYLVIQQDDGDEITFIKTFLGLLIVGKTNSIQKVYPDDSGHTVSGVYTHISCHAPYSTIVCPEGIVFLNRNGIYIFNGSNSYYISDVIEPDIEDILSTKLDNAVGVYSNNEYLLAYTSKESGAGYNNRVLRYNFVRQSYTKDTQKISSFCLFNSGTDQGEILSGSSNSGNLWLHNIGDNELIVRYKSDFENGSDDDTRVLGTQDDPILEIAWDCTIDSWLTELQSKNVSINTLDDINIYLSDAIIDRPDTNGTWISPVYRIIGTSLKQIIWNEDLNNYGDVTFQIRTGDVETPDVTWSSWSSEYTNPSGSDISSITIGNYIQIKINLSTTNINFTPNIVINDNYAFKVIYERGSGSTESNFLSTIKTGWLDFNVPYLQKRLERIIVTYTGESGDINFTYKDWEKELLQTFIIDTSIKSNAVLVNGDQYIINDEFKTYVHYCPIDTTPTGKKFMFTINNNGTNNVTIESIEVLYEIQNYY